MAIIGTGIIGGAIARNAARAGLRVSAWNRTHGHALSLVADGVEVYEHAADAARGHQVVMSALSNADATIAVMQPLLAQMAEDGAVWVQSATIGVEGIERCAELAEAAGVPLVDAPVSGTRTPAERGELVFLASGDARAAEFAAPLLDAAGAKTVWLGAVGNGSRMKLVTNSWVLSQTAALAEAMKLCVALGLPERAFLDAIDGAPVGNPYAEAKGEMFIAGEYPANFPLEHGTKDARLIAETARANGLELPVAEGTLKAFNTALENGRGDEDVAAIYDYVGTGSHAKE